MNATIFLRDPYVVLGVDVNAETEAIRTRYLELLRQFPPDRDPERFQQIRDAYAAITQPFERWRELLFPTAGDLLVGDLPRELFGADRISTDQLLAVGYE
jgi:hypothetical protein